MDGWLLGLYALAAFLAFRSLSSLMLEHRRSARRRWVREFAAERERMLLEKANSASDDESKTAA